MAARSPFELESKPRADSSIEGEFSSPIVLARAVLAHFLAQGVLAWGGSDSCAATELEPQRCDLEPDSSLDDR